MMATTTNNVRTYTILVNTRAAHDQRLVSTSTIRPSVRNL